MKLVGNEWHEKENKACFLATSFLWVMLLTIPVVHNSKNVSYTKSYDLVNYIK
jgi:hypothetical protein